MAVDEAKRIPGRHHSQVEIYIKVLGEQMGRSATRFDVRLGQKSMVMALNTSMIHAFWIVMS